MKIAFLGKGGTGKTTMTAATAARLRQNDESCLVIDADVNAHTDELLDIGSPDTGLAGAFSDFAKSLENREPVPPLGSFPVTETTDFIKDIGHDLLSSYTVKEDFIRYAQVGGYQDDDVNTGCYHEKLDSLEFLLHRMRENQHVLIDGTAGTDFAVSTLSFAVDAVVFVVEPTRKSLDIFNDYQELAGTQPMQVPTQTVWNNVEGSHDMDFLTNHAEQPLGVINRSPELKRYNQTGSGFESFVTENKAILDDITSLEPVSRDEAYREALQEAFKEEWQSWGKDYFGDIL
jgi:CO dehydrogenase maturation factor